MEETLKIGLFDPGMSHVHRVGLAGLYMSLKQFENEQRSIGRGSWRLFRDSVELTWSGLPRDFFTELLEKSFGIDDGLVDFVAHRGHAMGDLQRIAFSEAVRMTFLQHNKQNRIPKGTGERSLQFDFGDNICTVSFKPFVKPYANADSIDLLTNKKGKLKKTNKIKGWLFPGAAERHSSYTGTEIQEPPGRLLCLIFAPAAALFFKLSHRGADGKFDNRKSTAIVFPHLYDLEAYSRCYTRYLKTPVERLSADGLGDAGLSSLLALKAGDSLYALGLSGCSVVTMGQLGWSKQQKSRSGVFSIENIEEEVLERFDHAWRTLPNKSVVKETKAAKQDQNPEKSLFIFVSQARGLIAGNIAAGREWFRGFDRLMKSKKISGIISYEKGGLNQMIRETEWNYEADRKLVEAIHVAVRNRYGALAAEATKRGEAIRFDREYERMRTGLMRVKNSQTLRAELADLFARGGVNKTLQENWREILPLFSGQDWQRSRDLALLGLASYAGKGTEQLVVNTDEVEDNQ